jgi:hypothetical protein
MIPLVERRRAFSLSFFFNLQNLPRFEAAVLFGEKEPV